MDCSGAHSGELVSALFADYRQWTGANHEYAESQKAFSQNLESRGFVRGRTNAARTFHGVDLRSAGTVTDVTDSSIIGLTHAHGRECPIKADLSHPSPGRDQTLSYPDLSENRANEQANFYKLEF